MAIKVFNGPGPMFQWGKTGNMAMVWSNESTLAQVASRLKVRLSDLQQANPQIVNPNQLIPGQEIRIPSRETAGPGNNSATDTSADMLATTTAPEKETDVGAAVLRAKFNSSVPAAETAGAAGTEAVDPRFAAVNNALNTGDGSQAMGEAQKVIDQLQAERSPQPKLLSQARLSFAAGAILAGDLRQAQKTLLAIDPKKLNAADKQQFSQLRDLLADAHREAFTEAFKAYGSEGADAKSTSKAAADDAQNLLELLQKTDPTNKSAIDEARLKLANAHLAGGHYRQAEKALTGINEKQLGPELKQYHDDIHREIHAQQIDALGTAYASDVKHGRYKDAASNATAMVNNLAKYFPDAKVSIMAARLQQATAQIMNDDVEGARKSLAHVSREEFQAAPKEFQKQYRELNGYVDKYLQTEKKQKSERAELQRELQTIQMLVSSGNKDLAKDGVAKANELLIRVKEKYPTNTEVLDGMELIAANAQLAAGDSNGAMERLTKLASTTDDSDIKDQAQLLHAQAALEAHQTDQAIQILRSVKETTTDSNTSDQADLLHAQALLQGHQVDKGAQMLHSLSETASTPDARKTAKSLLVRLERNYLKAVYDKAGSEKVELDATLNDKWAKGDGKIDPNNENEIFLLGEAPKYGGPIINAVSMSTHVSRLNDLSHLQTGVRLAATIMKEKGVTVAELQKLSVQELSKLAGVSTYEAAKIQQALTNNDVKLIANDNFEGKQFTWDKGKLYVDSSYLDTPMDIAAKVIGKGLRALREGAQKLEDTRIPVLDMAGRNVGRIMDGVSAANRFVKDKIKNAYDFYARADHEGAWYGKLGLAGTFAGDQVSSVFTMPATIVDYKASDAERSAAITGTTLMAFGGGLLKAGGPAVVNVLGNMGRRVAIAKWAGKKLVALERGFENTGFAKAADKIKAGVKNGVDKLKNLVSGEELLPPKSVEQAVNEVLNGKSLDQARAGITPQDMAAMEEKLIKTKLADVKKNLTKKVIADLEQAGTSPSNINEMAKDIVDRVVERDFPKERLQKLVRQEFSQDDIRRMALGDRIYNDIYHGDFPPKTVNITNQEYAAQLDKSKGTPTNDPDTWNMPGNKGIVKEDNYWHHRLSRVDGEVGLDAAAVREGKDIRRFYFNLEPDKAAGLADYLTEKLGDARIRYQFKMPKEVERLNPKPGESAPFDRPDAGVLYVGKGDYQTVKNIVLEYAKKHPEAFAEGSPGFTKPLAKGISAAEEPLQQGLPPNGSGRYSFGELRSHLIADAFVQAPAGVTKEQLMQLVRQRLDWYGLDANRPWLSKSTTVDDL